jgi:hypothetical protein
VFTGLGTVGRLYTPKIPPLIVLVLVLVVVLDLSEALGFHASPLSNLALEPVGPSTRKYK